VNKTVPTFGRLAAIVLFALSCFGLLLYLWAAFGGAVPLAPKGYRFQVALPEATGLVEPVEVRSAGVRVGQIADTQRDERGNRTLATVEMDRKFAPIRRDARFTLRQKTLIGETYVEMTLGSPRAPEVQEGELLAGTQVREYVQIDELLDSFDAFTRASFRTWQQDLGAGIDERGMDLNDAIGNLPGLVGEARDLVTLLNTQNAALRQVVDDGGEVFDALSENDDQLRALIRNQSTVFGALQRERESFADLIRILPTFLGESRQTLARLEDFSRNTDPLVRDLQPALRRLRPTLVDLSGLSPDLQRLFDGLDPYIDVAQEGLPASREIFRELRPTFGALAPLLSEINPLLDHVALYQHQVTDLLNTFGSINAAKGFPTNDPGSPGHVTRQFSPTGPESQAFWERRRASNRGNAYLPPLAFADPDFNATAVLPAWDCANAGGERPAGETVLEGPECRVMERVRSPDGDQQFFPNLERRPYFDEDGGDDD
jgi:virulence factor Mce-like protein